MTKLLTQKPAEATTTGAAKPLSEFEALLLKDSKTKIEFKPFQSETPISLSVNIVRNYIAAPGKNGEVPDDRQCMRFIMLCRARLLNPFEGDAFMLPFWDSQANGYQWSLITAHNAFLKRAEVHPDYNGKESGVIVMGGDTPDLKELQGDFVPPGWTLLGGWARVYYKNKTHPEYQRLNLDTYKKSFGQWNKDAAGMICKCAEAAALRSAFPNTIGGMYLKEEMETEAPEPVLTRPIFATPKGKPQPEPPQDEPEETPPVAPSPTPSKPQEGGKAREVDSPKQPKPAKELKMATPAPTQKSGPIVVRELLKSSGLTEQQLIGFLAAIELVDAGTPNLEEVDLANDGLLAQVAEQWSEFVQRVREFDSNPIPE